MYSDDDGATWKTVMIGAAPKHEVRYPHAGLRWENSGVEPAIAELRDGTLYMLLRTSQDYHYECRSFDGGESWTEPEPSRFWATLTMPNLLTLRDERLLAIWNNSTPLPELDHYNQMGLNEAECKGFAEDVFTNRDVLHAAISEDDGVNWIGFRELLLDEVRNSNDFRRHGGFNAYYVDKSIHQTQALEVEEGKILLAVGQHPACARLLLFDPDFLYEKKRSDDFSTGLTNWSVQQYLKSPSGNYRGFGGHCSWNRRAGSSLVPDPECWHKEVLQIARHPDERLIFEKEGACWNFPSGQKGIIKLRLYQEAGSSGIQLALLDHWLNPVDPVISEYAQFLFCLNSCGRWSGMQQAACPLNSWYELKISFNLDEATAVMTFPELEIPEVKLPLLHSTPNGISYIHLQSTATSSDIRGVLLQSVEVIINA